MIPYRVSPRIHAIAGILLVTVILVVADVAATFSALKFLLLPPFGALAYLVFVNPAQVLITVRRVVFCPIAAALLAWGLASTIEYNIVSIAAATLGTIALMWLLDAAMVVPPVALELLTLLLHRQVRGDPIYPASVCVFTVGIYLLYQIWDRLVVIEEAASETA